MKNKRVLLFLLVFSVLYTNAIEASEKKVHNQELGAGKEQILSKKIGNSALDYATPSFNNPNYYYAAIKTPPVNVWYRQAGFSSDGTKIVAAKQYTDGSYTRREVVLMSADGSGETIISAGNSGEGDIYGYMNPFWRDRKSTRLNSSHQ